MHDFIELLKLPLVWKILLFYWLLNAFVTALPTPTDKSDTPYVVIFRFLHALSGSVVRAAVALRVVNTGGDSK